MLHTINPRLFPEQIAYIVNHAEDRYLFFDVTFAPLVEALAPRLPSVKGFVAMTDRAHMPALDVQNLLCYEDWIGAQSADYDWPELDERTASSLCYTSGTTGNPKGVLYSHRSTLLHAYAACMVDDLGLSAAESVLLVVPMFHVNGWGMPYAAAMSGAKLVLPGPGARRRERLRADEGRAGDARARRADGLAHAVPARRRVGRRIRSATSRCGAWSIGGSAAPRAMSERFETQFGAFVVHALGHDGDVAARHRLQPAAEAPGPRPRRGASTCRRSRVGRCSASR